MTTFADRIKTLRKILGLSREAFARHIHRDHGLIGHWETGHYKTANPQTLHLIEHEFGVSMLWLTEGKGPVFCNYRKGLQYIHQRIQSGEILLLPEIWFLLYLIKDTWSKRHPANSGFCKNVFQIYEFVSGKIRNPEHFGGVEHFKRTLSYSLEAAPAIVDELLWLLGEGKFELKELDLGVICSYLLPWGYYVALASTNKDRVPVPSVYFGDLSFLQNEIEITEKDLPEHLKLENGMEFYCYDRWSSALQFRETGLCHILIPYTEKDSVMIGLTLGDLVEFILLIQNAPEQPQSEEEEGIEFTLGRYRLYVIFPGEARPEKSYTLQFREEALELHLSEEKFTALKQIVAHISQKKNYLRFLYKRYVEKYGFV